MPQIANREDDLQQQLALAAAAGGRFPNERRAYGMFCAF